MQARALGRATLHGHEGQTEKQFCKSLWSALQTHLQGVDRTTLAIVPEKRRHRAALLSRLSEVKITRLAKEGKPKPPPSQPRRREGLKQQETPAIDKRGDALRCPRWAVKADLTAAKFNFCSTPESGL
jgi:hypothetical protein